MTESESKTSEREIMPLNLFRHHVEGRRRAYAGGGEYLPSRVLPGHKTFYWRNPDQPYYFEDSYVDNSQRPGDYGGAETDRDSTDNSILIFYVYGGGLTRKGEQLGEAIVYSSLKKFLAEHADEVRFGKTVRFEFRDELGIWVYESEGKIGDWGWVDEEMVSLNGKLVHEHVGTGRCYLPNY